MSLTKLFYRRTRIFQLKCEIDGNI